MECLIANDEPLQLNILEMLFKNTDFRVTCARNGFEAFDLVQQKFKVEQKSYNLIVLDLHMPIADGFEAIKNINQLYEDNNLFQMEKDCSSNDH